MNLKSYPLFRRPESLNCRWDLNSPRASGHLSRRGATCQIARVRQHPSHPTRRGNRKGRGGVRGPMGGGRSEGATSRAKHKSIPSWNEKQEWAGVGLRGPTRELLGPENSLTP
jgi:hypothetical protein